MVMKRMKFRFFQDSNRQFSYLIKFQVNFVILIIILVEKGRGVHMLKSQSKKRRKSERNRPEEDFKIEEEELNKFDTRSSKRKTKAKKFDEMLEIS